MTDFEAKYAWWLDAARLRVGLLKRPQPQVPRLTRPKWNAEINELGEFAGWLLWFAGGKKGRRPAFHARVPAWAWKVQGEYALAHPKPKPDPPGPKPGPEPVSRWKNPPWRGIGVHVTWGFNVGQFTPQQLADRIATTRIEWAFLELNPAEYNEQYADAFRDALHGHDRRFGIWERADAQKSFPESRIEHVTRIVNSYKPEFYGADIEEFPVDTPELPGQIAAAFPNLPRVMLVPGQPDASFLTPWFTAGFDMMTQSYAANIGQPPVPGIAGAVDHDTYWRGGPRNFIPAPKGWGSEWWQHGTGPHSVPIIETMAEGNPGLRAQADCDAIKWFGGNWSIWAAELMTDDDWAFVS